MTTTAPTRRRACCKFGVSGRYRQGASRLDAGFAVSEQDYKTRRTVTDTVHTSIADADYSGRNLGSRIE